VAFRSQQGYGARKKENKENYKTKEERNVKQRVEM
jgi:hypothetical protein